MKKILILLLITTALNTYAQTYEDSSVEYERTDVYAQEEEDAPYLEPIDYPEEYIPEDTEYTPDTEYYEEP